MGREYRFIHLPGNWGEMSEEEIERLSIRADRVQEILPDLPPLERRVSTRPRRFGADEMPKVGDTPSTTLSSAGRDHPTDLDQATERDG